MPSPSHFLAIDLETTGLDPKRDRILEIGLAFVHAQTLEVVAEQSWIVPVRWGSLVMPHPAVLEMHAASGLWVDLADAKGEGADEEHNRRLVAHAVLKWARSTLAELANLKLNALTVVAGQEALRNLRGPMLGSSVHFDREFLRHADGGSFAGLLNLWTHRNLDVSAIKECAKAWAPDLEVPEPAEPKHRVLSDIRNSVSLLDFYRRVKFLGTAEPVTEANFLDGL